MSVNKLCCDWFIGCGSGIKIIGYVVKNDGKDWVELGSKSPQDPQVNGTYFLLTVVLGTRPIVVCTTQNAV